MNLIKNTKYVAFVNSEHWETLQELAQEAITSIEKERIVGHTVEEYAIGCIEREGKIAGIHKLLKTIENYANNASR